jgi:phage shock protein A
MQKELENQLQNAENNLSKMQQELNALIVRLEQTEDQLAKIQQELDSATTKATIDSFSSYIGWTLHIDLNGNVSWSRNERQDFILI